MDQSSIQPKNTNLIETTTPLQASRGNRQFFCKQHKVSYISYSNGYVRREINAEYTSPYTASSKAYNVQDQFVINRRKSIPNQWGFNSKKVIKENCAQCRMNMIDNISSSYKGYRGRFTNPGHTLIVR